MQYDAGFVNNISGHRKLKILKVPKCEQGCYLFSMVSQCHFYNQEKSIVFKICL